MARRSASAVILAGAVLLAALSPLAVAADAGHGADVFDAQCAECHSVAAKLKNKKGPSLYGVTGRQAGSVAGFEYSPAMQAAGFAWTADKLDAYLTNPRSVVPGGAMKFDGLPNAADRADVIAFLADPR